MVKCDLDFDSMYGAQSVGEFLGAEQYFKYELDSLLVDVV